MISKDFTLPSGVVINEWKVKSVMADFEDSLVVVRLQGFITGHTTAALDKSVIVKAKKSEWTELVTLGMTKQQVFALVEGVVSSMDLSSQDLPDFRVQE